MPVLRQNYYLHCFLVPQTWKLILLPTAYYSATIHLPTLVRKNSSEKKSENCSDNASFSTEDTAWILGENSSIDVPDPWGLSWLSSI